MKKFFRVEKIFFLTQKKASLDEPTLSTTTPFTGLSLSLSSLFQVLTTTAAVAATRPTTTASRKANPGGVDTSSSSSLTYPFSAYFPFTST